MKYSQIAKPEPVQEDRLIYEVHVLERRERDAYVLVTNPAGIEATLTHVRDTGSASELALQAVQDAFFERRQFWLIEWHDVEDAEGIAFLHYDREAAYNLARFTTADVVKLIGREPTDGERSTIVKALPHSTMTEAFQETVWSVCGYGEDDDDNEKEG